MDSSTSYIRQLCKTMEQPLTDVQYVAEGQYLCRNIRRYGTLLNDVIQKLQMSGTLWLLLPFVSITPSVSLIGFSSPPSGWALRRQAQTVSLDHRWNLHSSPKALTVESISESSVLLMLLNVSVCVWDIFFFLFLQMLDTRMLKMLV